MSANSMISLQRTHHSFAFVTNNRRGIAVTPTSIAVSNIQVVNTSGSITHYSTFSDVTITETDDDGTPTPTVFDGNFVGVIDVAAIAPPEGGQLHIFFTAEIQNRDITSVESFNIEAFTASEVADESGNPNIV